jgi:GT2 family glycosyltransferase
MANPAIAVIVCTRDRVAQLRRCLAALAEQDVSPACWELIVVNNGSRDDTSQAVTAFARTVPFRVVVVEESRPGQSRARNAGVSATCARIIAFTDDDCYAAPDFVRQVLQVFELPMCYGYVGGRILLHDASDALETIRPEVDPEEIAAGEVLMPGWLHGANLAFRRSVWAAIGGFDPAFGPGTPFVCDDVDFACRTSLAGYRGAYRPEPLIYHHHGRKPGPDVDRLHATYARGRGAYYMKGCLRSSAQQTFRRRWYWHLRTQWRRRRFREIWHELQAALSYAARSCA